MTGFRSIASTLLVAFLLASNFCDASASGSKAPSSAETSKDLPKTKDVKAKTIEDDAGNTIPDHYTLAQNYPNPFNPITTIRFGLPRAEHVTLEIFNNLGQKITTLLDAPKRAGNHTIQFTADRLASGIYFYRIKERCLMV